MHFAAGARSALSVDRRFPPPASMFAPPWRYSGADGRLCSMNGCWDSVWCMCQECPICAQRVPLIILETYKHRQTPAGVWVGPHCLGCDVNIFCSRDLGEEWVDVRV